MITPASHTLHNHAQAVSNTLLNALTKTVAGTPVAETTQASSTSPILDPLGNRQDPVSVSNLAQKLSNNDMYDGMENSGIENDGMKNEGIENNGKENEAMEGNDSGENEAAERIGKKG